VRILLCLSVVLFACTPGDGMRFQLIDMQKPTESIGLQPPADYQPCYSGEARGLDTNGDGKIDKIAVSVDGKGRCYGEDTDHDGKIDTWDVMDENGNLSKRAQDTNGDGRVDQAWTFDPTRHGCATVAADQNGDGKPDPGSPVDICRSITVPAAPPAASTR
jgi:hypothetical protein